MGGLERVGGEGDEGGDGRRRRRWKEKGQMKRE